MAFDAATGEPAWQYKVDHGHLLGSPAADEQCVYVATMLGRVNAVKK
jgi:outer membrane protein assembly factor BamB